MDWFPLLFELPISPVYIWLTLGSSSGVLIPFAVLVHHAWLLLFFLLRVCRCAILFAGRISVLLKSEYPQREKRKWGDPCRCSNPQWQSAEVPVSWYRRPIHTIAVSLGYWEAVLQSLRSNLNGKAESQYAKFNRNLELIFIQYAAALHKSQLQQLQLRLPLSHSFIPFYPSCGKSSTPHFLELVCLQLVLEFWYSQSLSRPLSFPWLP